MFSQKGRGGTTARVTNSPSRSTALGELLSLDLNRIDFPLGRHPELRGANACNRLHRLAMLYNNLMRLFYRKMIPCARAVISVRLIIHHLPRRRMTTISQVAIIVSKHGRGS